MGYGMEISTSLRISYLLKACLFLSAILCGSCQTIGMEELTISIQNDTTTSNNIQTVQLSFVLGRDQVVDTRSIRLATGSLYNFECALATLDFEDGGVWRKNDVAVSTDDSSQVYARRVNSKAWNLVITSFSADEAGVYTCLCDGISRSIDISVGNPSVISGTPYLYVDSGPQSGSSSTLSCFVSGTFADGVWTRSDGTDIASLSNTIISGRVLLFFASISLSHGGEYIYTVTTDAGTDSATFVLEVIVPPSVEVSAPSEYGALGSIDITCNSTGVPLPQLMWTFNDQPLESEGLVNISNVTNTTTATSSRLQIASITPTEHNGEYQCLARNSPDPEEYRGKTVTITVLFPTLPPVNITATPTSPCTATLDWTAPPTDNSVEAQSYNFQIQYSNTGEWEELRIDSTSFTITSQGLNTAYSIRGRGYNSTYGNGPYSVSYGPFFSYQDSDFPTLSNVVGRPSGSNSIVVSWDIAESACYVFLNATVSCEQSGGDSSTPVTVEVGVAMGEVRGLVTDTTYSCEVFGVFADGANDDANVMQSNTIAVTSFTWPQEPQSPPTPEFDDTTVSENSFTIALEPLSSVSNISHYQIIVLRLASADNAPTGAPPTSSEFSNCTQVNSLNSQQDVFLPYIAAEVSAERFPESFEVGSGVKESEGCNTALVPGGVYTVYFRAYPVCQSCRETERRRRRQTVMVRQYDVFSTSDYLLPPVTTQDGPPPSSLSPSSPPIATEGSPSPTPKSSMEVVIIVVTVVVVTVFLALVILVVIGSCCLYQRTRMKEIHFSPSVDHSVTSSASDLAEYRNTDSRTKNKNGTEMKAMEAFADPMDASLPFQPSGAIKEAEFAKHVERFDAKRQLLFQEEFEWISKQSPWHAAEGSNDPNNDHKNRYSNITAFDHSAVKLNLKSGDPCSDYINANYISGYSRAHEYIATQGPLDRTVEDFWRMIWEQNTTTIIMLTNLVELGKIKCSQYWPSNSKTMYGDIAVTLDSTHYFPDYIIRTLIVQLSTTNEQRRVLLFHYTKWPDYGTPKLAAPLLNFLKIVHESNDGVDTGPMVVHCSAGVGRSGTVLTIDYCLQQLRHDGLMNICKFVCDMRDQRNYMVQTDQQYTFIHYALLEAITYGDTSYDLSSFKKSYSKLQSPSSSPNTSPIKMLLEEEFQRLGAVKTMVKKSSFQNRIKMKGAPQRHFHSSFHGGSTSGSLQQCLGHFMDGYNHPNLFVVTEGPVESTATRFWDMVRDHHCSFIIMLTPLDDEDLFCYWPESGESMLQFGPTNVLVESEKEEHLYTCRKIRLTNTKVEGISHELVQYQFKGWTAQFLPRVPDFVSFVCDVLTKVDTSVKNSRILVHDMASLGPVGVFCSLFYSIQRLQMEKMVDIFQAVQMIQLQRPGCVTQLEEYAFLYDCIYEFLMKNS